MQVRSVIRSTGPGVLDAASWDASLDARGDDLDAGAAMSDSAIDRLERLARLRDRGILTNRELQAQKRALLGV
jgi:hypothetical protein